MRRRNLFLMLLGSILISTTAVVEAGGPAQGKLYGKTYGEWSASWWQWAHSIPGANSPVLLTDDDPNYDCSIGQQGPVWYLAGLPTQFAGFDNFISLEGERTCFVPRGRSIFFPLVNSSFVNESGEMTCADGPLEGPCTVEEKREILAAFGEASFGCSLEISIDGDSAYTQLIAKTQSSPYAVVAGPDDPFGLIEGSFDDEAIADGFWAMIPPLDAGDHELIFQGSLCSSTPIENPEPGTAPFSLKPFFSVRVIYHLTVGK